MQSLTRSSLDCDLDLLCTDFCLSKVDKMLRCFVACQPKALPCICLAAERSRRALESELLEELAVLDGGSFVCPLMPAVNFIHCPDVQVHGSRVLLSSVVSHVVNRTHNKLGIAIFSGAQSIALQVAVVTPLSVLSGKRNLHAACLQSRPCPLDLCKLLPSLPQASTGKVCMFNVAVWRERDRVRETLSK